MRLISGETRIGVIIVIVGTVAAGCGKIPARMATTNKINGISDVTVRRATMAQAQSLTVMINNAFNRRLYNALFKPGDATRRVTPDGKQVATLMETPCNAFLVAEETRADGTLQPVGCVHVTWSGITDSKDPDVDAHFGMLSVPTECSGRGIGKLLVSSAERWCREQLKREDIVIEITVMSHREDLFRWYESQGYKMGGKIPFPLPDIVKDGIHVELQLMTKKIP